MLSAAALVLSLRSFRSCFNSPAGVLRRAGFPLLLAALFVAAAPPPSAHAAMVSLSTHSSEAGYPTSGVLDATLSIGVMGSQLTLTLTNDTTAPDAFLINGFWFNAEAHVSGLSLQSATHSVEGDVYEAWKGVETYVHRAGFGTFDYGLTGGVGGQNPNLIGPGESVVFVFMITGTGPFAEHDFISANDREFTAAAKFVSGPDDASAFGATNQVAPEPGTALLFGAGLLGLAGAGRRRRHLASA